MGSVQGFRTGQTSTRPTTKAAKPSDRINLTIMTAHDRYMARKQAKSDGAPSTSYDSAEILAGRPSSV
jgi:hypothetical protein